MIMSLLCAVSISSFGCASKSDSVSVSENQIVTVQRGNLIIDITAIGNLALSRTEDLAFDIFYQEATVEEVLVEEGDTVEEGQVLAKLDAEEWEDELSTLEDAVTAAKRNLTTKGRELIQAEINLKNAEIALDEAEGIYTWPEIEVAQSDVDAAEAFLQYVIDMNLDRVLAYAQSRLTAAENKLNAMINQYDTEQVVVKKLEVEVNQIKLKEAQIAVEDAQKELEDAQEELNEAKSKSPIITASFDGFITKVNVEGGDEVLTGTVAVQIADPDKFEAEIMVSEMDIFQVKEGGEAWVQVDAMPGLSLPAKVTHISPTATIQSGVVNYEVKVEIESLQTALQERQGARQKAMQEISPIPEDFQLREGLTVTVNIIVDERNDVLLAPNTAITSQRGQTYVQVLKDGVIEERSITAGISNWQYTEVTDGLSEGEKVVVPETTTTPTTPQPGGRMPFFPGKH